MKKLFTNLVAVVLVASVTACTNFSLGDSQIEGTVLDAATDKPVVGAIVIAQWKGNIHGIVQGSSMCYHTETALTDANGRFVIPAWRRKPLTHMEEAVTDKERDIIVYMEDFNNRGVVPMRDQLGVIRIRRATATGDERLQDIGVGVDYGCGWDDGSAAQLDRLRVRKCAERAALLSQFGKPAEQCDATPFATILKGYKR